MRGTLKTALWPLQKAVFERLAQDPIIKTMVGVDEEENAHVYDEVKEGAQLPFITIGDDTVNPYDTKTYYGEDLTLTLHTWSAGPGKTETKRIMDAVLQAITAMPLIIPGFSVEGIEREFLETLNDGEVYHGICRFRVYIKQ
jgi:hypothetical protein